MSGQRTWEEVQLRLSGLLEGETDSVAVMATVACELHHAFAHFDWTGFYRVTSPRLLTVGPYQGSHGCLRIPFDKGVCGAAARTGQTQMVPDVNAIDDHIACSSSTQSEVVVPVIGSGGRVLAVLDVDSNALAAFSDEDRVNLESVCALIAPVLDAGGGR